MPEAAKVHQELLDPEVPADLGGAPEALLAAGEVPRQAQHHGGLLRERAGPVALLGRPDPLQVSGGAEERVREEGRAGGERGRGEGRAGGERRSREEGRAGGREETGS